MSLASAERAAICDEFEKVGPAAPTLSGDWTTRDLLAHLLVRERAPWASGGIMIPLLAPITERAMRGWNGTPWAEMIGVLRAGAPIWSPFAIGKVDELANGAELFIHHEDVRRGAPGWAPREFDAERDRQVWAVLQRTAKLMLRSSKVGVALRTPDGRHVEAKAGRGVTVVGSPEELVLYTSGRSAVQVEIDGAPDDVTTFEQASRGF
jgi:uncharacterized protein (TIGR03085 family)